MWYAHDVGWGWGLLMAIGMVAIAVLAIYALMSLARGGANASTRRVADPALTMLNRRLAVGELSIEQYERLRDTLEEPRTGGDRLRTANGVRPSNAREARGESEDHDVDDWIAGEGRGVDSAAEAVAREGDRFGPNGSREAEPEARPDCLDPAFRSSP